MKEPDVQSVAHRNEPSFESIATYHGRCRSDVDVPAGPNGRERLGKLIDATSVHSKRKLVDSEGHTRGLSRLGHVATVLAGHC